MSAPDWDIAVIGDEPVEVINAAAVAQLIRTSPLGVTCATARMRATLPPHLFTAIEKELAA
jgi:hypothetical protein